MRRWLPALIAALVACLGASAAAAKGGLTRGMNPASIEGRWLDETVRSASDVALYFVGWRAVAATQPADPRNPADPAYNFSAVDAAVRGAASRGLDVVLTVTSAPRWAEGAKRPPGVTAGTWKPDPKAFGDFGAAIARRYSGSFSDAGGPLPAVKYFEAWSEPNLTALLNPQYSGRRPVVVEHYRRMLNAFYAGVHAANSNAQVIAPGLAPYGDDPPKSDRTRPLLFLRKLLCLEEGRRHRLIERSCPNPAHFDILSHHPINLSGGPETSAKHPDDVSTPDVRHMVRTLRIAERKGTLRPRGRRRPVWATELWWETAPPDRSAGFPIKRVVRWVPRALRGLWEQGVSVVIWGQLFDDMLGPGGLGFQDGLLLNNGQEKPLFHAWRFPFVASRHNRSSVAIWTLAPASGDVSVEVRRGGGWRRIGAAEATDSVPLELTLRLVGKATLRARFADEASLPWSVGRR